MSMHHMYDRCSWRPKSVLNPLDLELQEAVSWHALKVLGMEPRQKGILWKRSQWFCLRSHLFISTVLAIIE